MTPADYERLVKSLMKTTFDDMDARAFHLKKYTGKSGQQYEIDVSFEILVGTLELIILIECKRYKRPVTVEEVANFAYKLRDVGAHKGALVSPNGFQRGALRVAKAERIGLLIVHDKIELRPKEIKTVLSLTRMTREEYLPWFSSCHLKLMANTVDTVALEERSRIPKNRDHFVVEFGETDNTLGQPQLRVRLLDHAAYFSPCFRVFDDDDAIE